MRLTEPGLYVARDGRRAMSYQCMTGLAFTIAGEDTRCEFAISGSPQTEGEWQKIDLAAVTWPEMQAKPKQCYVTYETDGPMWLQFLDGKCVCSGLSAKHYKVVPHDGNDREAVAMIEAARKESQSE